jgi:hypothetical protein
MKRPVSVTIVVVLQWVAAVVAVITGFDLIAAAYEMRQNGVSTQIEGALVSQGIVDVSGRTVVAGVFVAGILLLGIAFVRVMVAVYLARGRAWARVVVAVFALLSLAGGLAQLFQGLWLSAVGIAAIEVLVLYLLFNAQSAMFFRARAAADA